MAALISNQEIPQDQGFVAFFNSLPEKTSTTIRFFERNDYYTVHGVDAIFVAKEVFKTLSVVKTFGSGSLKTESVCLSKLNFESLLKDLLFMRQYRVEIYRSKGSSRAQEWTLECKASPGNLTQLEEVLFGNEGCALVDSKGVIAVKVKSGSKEQVVGIAFGDAILREFRISEFTDNSLFSELEAAIIQLSPKECLLAPIPDSTLASEIKQVIKRNNIMLVECKLGDFNATDVTQDLDRLLKSKTENKLQSSTLPEADMKVAMQCVSAIIRYFELLSDESNFGEYALTSFNSKLYMHLDASAVRALGILPASAEENKSHSLFGLLNRCRTAQGQRLLTQWIKQPLMDLKAIEERLNMVETFVNDTEMRQSLFENFLRKIPDLQMMAKKFQKRKADLQDVYKIYIMINQLPALLTCLSKHDGPYSYALKATFCSDIKDRIKEFDRYQDMVKSVMDLEAAEEAEFIVKSDCSPELRELRVLMQKTQTLISHEIEKVANDLGLEANKTVKLENCRQIGYYFRVTRKEEKALRNKKNYFTIDTKQNGVRFYNASLKELNEKYLSLRNSYEKYQNKLVEQLIDIAATYCLPMKQLGGTIAQLDVLVAFASAAFNAPKPYVRPKLSEKGTKGIVLKQARHPCLEIQPNVDFIPNDIEMEKERCMFFIITGPNMGGKSTFIRSVALNVLMAQIGSFVPCDSAEISIVDALLTRVGAGDKPMKGVSTFMAEMLEVKHILKTATADSLIIVDELGRGTSTYDGLGLAWALSEYIATSLKSYCLFTTHFHELAALSEEIESVTNLHVTAVTTEEDITFLYRVKPGVCDQSFGIHVAEMARFPKSVIEFASEKIKELERFEMCKSAQHFDVKIPVRKHKCEIEEANKTFESFLCNAVKIDTNDITEEAACSAVKKLRTDLESSNNPYVLEMISKY